MRSNLLVVSILALSFVPFVSSAQEPIIAGVRPDRRPAAAPVLSDVEKDAEWYARALHGVDAPYPFRRRFLEYQRARFTPFRFPGMTAPYDIRTSH